MAGVKRRRVRGNFDACNAGYSPPIALCFDKGAWSVMAKSEGRVSSTKTMQAVGSRFDADCVKQHFNNSIILLVSQDRPVNALQYR